MSLINLLIVLVLVGVLLWAINNYIPMDRKIKSILNLVVVIIVVLWLLQVFGVIGPLDNIRIGADSGQHYSPGSSTPPQLVRFAGNADRII